MMLQSMMPDDQIDLLVVGAGIVGLAHAHAAQQRGLRVHVIERDHRAVGASTRNFGHVCLTAQSGQARAFAIAGRSTWLDLASAAGFAAEESGTVVVARGDDELAVLQEFASERDGEVEMLGSYDVAARVPSGDDVVGGAWLPADLRIDPRSAAGAIAGWLEQSRRVTFSWNTSLLALVDGGATTSRGPIDASHVVVCVGHDADRVCPAVADSAGLQRCRLHMLQVENPTGRTIRPAILSGLSLLRYSGFSSCPSAVLVRERVRAARPELLDCEMNLMVTAMPDGSLVIGDTHHDALTHVPYAEERFDQLLLAEAGSLLGVDSLTVRSRWRGEYAVAAGEFMIANPTSTARLVTVTSGIGMTTAFGLAEQVLDELARSTRPDKTL